MLEIVKIGSLINVVEVPLNVFRQSCKGFQRSNLSKSDFFFLINILKSVARLKNFSQKLL